jgi:hypothetical protein
MYEAEGSMSREARPSGRGNERATGVRNSIGVLSEVLSTVIDRPCERGVVCE